MYDIIVIGAGVTGTCTARELSKYQVNMCVIDKGDDVASGTLEMKYEFTLTN